MPLAAIAKEIDRTTGALEASLTARSKGEAVRGDEPVTDVRVFLRGSAGEG